MNDQEIIAKVEKAVALHKGAKKEMVMRMRALLDPVEGPIEIAGHVIKHVSVYGRCSQWGDNSHAVTGEAGCYVVDNEKTIGSPSVGHFDGHNQQYQFSGLYADEQCEDKLSPASAKLLREIARDLPAALIAYAERMEISAGKNNLTLA